MVYDNVPIFDEHESEDGVTYDRRLLQIIAENCNRRIRDTGDWCPLVIGHTSDEDAAADPPLVGFAGPFTVGQLGKERPRWAILAKFWLFPDQAKVMARYPRRSVEVWPGDRPEDRYFDPIALLGAETPRRDLGLIYSKPRLVSRRVTFKANVELPERVYSASGKLFYSRSAAINERPERYEAGFPSGTSTFIPAKGGDTRKPARYQEGMTMPLAEGDLQQIVEAIKPTIQSIVDQQLGGAMGDELSDDELGLDDVGAPPSGDLNAPPAGGPPPPGGPPPAIGAPPPATPPGPPGDLSTGAPAPSPDEDDEAQTMRKYMAMKFRKYGQGEDGGKAWYEGLDDEHKDGLRKYMQSCDSDDDKQRYAKLDSEFKFEPAAAPADPAGAQKYRKQRDEWKIKYSRLNEQHADLRQKYAKMEGEVHRYRKEAWDSQRKTDLTELSTRGIVFDMDDELEETEAMTADQFARHKDKMATHYQRAPMHHIPVDRTQAPIAVKPGDHSKYSNQAKDIVLKYMKTGKKLSYGKVLSKLTETKGAAKDDDLAKLTE